MSTLWLELRKEGGKTLLVPHGEWRIAHIPRILKANPLRTLAETTLDGVDGGQLQALDTAGALLLFRYAQGGVLPNKLTDIQFLSLSPKHTAVVEIVRSRWGGYGEGSRVPPLSITQRVGKATLDIIERLLHLLAFIGETFFGLWRTVKNPRNFRVKEFFAQLEQVLVDAIPIICLVTGLIGIVLAYLFAMQLVKYGATIFVVDGTVLAMCRELSPVIVAITLAGRSGSAFTAQIGTMKMNQEIDAMYTMGLSPISVLVIPRMIALMIALPLLTFVGDLIGSLGGVIICDSYVGLPPPVFFDRVQSYFPYKSFYFGLMKAPIFAVFIATIGCMMGLAVEKNARSVGEHTTSTVVQSIVCVIIIDALFAVLFANRGFY